MEAVAAEKARKDEREYPNLEGDDEWEEKDLRVVFDQRDRSRGPAISCSREMNGLWKGFRSKISGDDDQRGFGIYFIAINKIVY